MLLFQQVIVTPVHSNHFSNREEELIKHTNVQPIIESDFAGSVTTQVDSFLGNPIHYFFDAIGESMRQALCFKIVLGNISVNQGFGVNFFGTQTL